MSMGDELTSATVKLGTQIGEFAIDATGKLIDKTFEAIESLLEALSDAMSRRAAEKSSEKVKSSDLTDIKSGAVKPKDLKAHAKANGETLAVSENAFTKADMKMLAKKAKRYGIPIAFVNKKSKDNIYAQIRTSDLPIFKNICTEMMKEKLATRPQELGNFKVKAWEIPFITNELNKHDLAAQFGMTKNGEHLCLYEKADEKAIMIARSEFVKKCEEVNKQISFDRDEDGNYTIKDLQSGKEVSFDKSMSRSELYENMKREFGFDDNKAQIACAKFGEEQLDGDVKKKFFSNDPKNEFSKVQTNVSLDGESILVKPYTCFRVTPKTDSVPRLVYQDSNGDFAVLNPEKMSRSKMTEILQTQLHIEDKATINALIDKAQKVTDFYTKQDTENMKHDYEFQKFDFDMSDPEVVSNMSRIDENGNTLTKSLPLDSVENVIERDNKEKFTVTSTFNHIETDKDGNTFTSASKEQLILSFSDKKDAAKKITDMYKRQGVPDHIAKEMAHDVINKAAAQSAEKVVQIEEVKADQASYGENSISVEVAMKCGSKNTTQNIDILNPESAKEDIMSAFNVSKDAADKVVEDTKFMITERELNLLKAKGFENVDDTWTLDQAHDVIKRLEQNGWKVPDDIDPKTYRPDGMDEDAPKDIKDNDENADPDPLKNDTIDAKKVEAPEVGKGDKLPDVGGDKAPEMPKHSPKRR